MKLGKHEKAVLSVLEHSELALSVSELADQADLHRVTAGKYLDSLEAKGLVSKSTHGRAKLYSVNAKEAVKVEIEEPALKELQQETHLAVSVPSQTEGSNLPVKPVVPMVQAVKPVLVEEKPITPIQKLAALELYRDGLLPATKTAKLTGLPETELEAWLKAVKGN